MGDKERPELFTLEFWQATITQAVHGTAAAGLGPLIAHQANLIGNVPWYGVLSSMAVGALISFLGSLTTLRIPGRVPGSFLSETDHEKRIEQLVMREERLAKERIRLRDKEIQLDRHRAPEPSEFQPYPGEYSASGEMQTQGETASYTDHYNPETDDFFANLPAPTRRERPVVMPQKHENPYATSDYNEEKELPYHPPLPTYQPYDAHSPEDKDTAEDDMEDWPQGGRRGKD